MLKLWVLYNLLLTLAILGSSAAAARTVPEFLLSALLLPLAFYLGRELLKKRRYRLRDPILFASSAPTSPAVLTASDSLAENGQLVGLSGISDDNRRLFLKLVGSTGLSLFFMALIGKKSAHAAFFGSLPGPGTIALKDSAGTLVDPAILQPTDGFEITEVDDAGTPSYYGFVHKTGAWYITKEDSTGSYRYAKGATLFSNNWTNRASLTYDYFDNVF